MLELLSTSSEIVGPRSLELANLGTRSRVATSRGRGQTSVNKRDSAEVELKEIVEQLKMKHPDLPLASFSYFSYHPHIHTDVHTLTHTHTHTHTHTILSIPLPQPND